METDVVEDNTDSSFIKKKDNWNGRPSCSFGKSNSPLNSALMERINGQSVVPKNTKNHDFNSEEMRTNDTILVNLEIGDKIFENIPIKSGCLLQDLAEEFAENEAIQVAYFLNERIKKGGELCDVNDAQVLIKLRSNWKWIPIDDLLDDLTLTVEEAFPGIQDNFQITFSLAPRSQRSHLSQAETPESPIPCNSNEVHEELNSKSPQEMKPTFMLNMRCIARHIRTHSAQVKKKTAQKPARKVLPRQLAATYSRARNAKKNAAVAQKFRKHKEENKPALDSSASVSSGPRETIIEPSMKNPAFIPDDSIDFKQRVSSFGALGLRQDVLKALDGMNVTKPTVIQMVTVPKILLRNHVLAAAQTGSGKTIAYLAPLVHHLREEEERHGIVARLNRPRACVVVPARELAVQVLKVAKAFSHHAKFRSMGVIGGRKQKWIRKDLENPVDLVVATPGTLLKYRQKDRLFFSDLTHLVIDEADTMFDSSFKKLSMEILHTINVRESKPPLPNQLPIDTQVTIVGATLPDELLVSTLNEIVPNMTKCTSGLHRVLPHVRHMFVKINQKDKAERLVELLQKDSRQGGRTVVFCNSASSCDWLGHYLDKMDFSFIRLHGNIPPEIRCQLFEDFQKRVSDILICTDVASRGLDTSDVTHVINFDFPTSVVDYIHRVGRTGRVSHVIPKVTCRATSFVTHNRDARMAKTIEVAAKKKESLDLGKSRDRAKKEKLLTVQKRNKDTQQMQY